MLKACHQKASESSIAFNTQLESEVGVGSTAEQLMQAFLNDSAIEFAALYCVDSKSNGVKM